MEHISFPSINQFRQIVKNIRSSADYHGVPYPKVKYEVSVKIHGCVHESTLVSLANGSQKRIKDIHNGEVILSYNTETSEIETDIVTNVIFAELEKEWCELVFDTGTTLKCTFDHPVLTSRGYIKAIDLTEDDIIVHEFQNV